MCDNTHHTDTSEWHKGKAYRLADFFDQQWDVYKQSPTEYITPEQYKAVNAMRVCRTEALGVVCSAPPYRNDPSTSIKRFDKGQQARTVIHAVANCSRHDKGLDGA